MEDNNTTTKITMTHKESNNNNDKKQSDDPLTEGLEVEVNVEEEGFKGSWYSATILKPISKKTGELFLQYHNLMSEDDRSEPLTEWVDHVLVRPIPPREASRSFKASEEVDALHNDGWWEGVVIEAFLDEKTKKNKCSVYFRTSREQLVFDESDLRLHREWVYGNWVPPLEHDSTVSKN